MDRRLTLPARDTQSSSLNTPPVPGIFNIGILHTALDMAGTVTNPTLPVPLESRWLAATTDCVLGHIRIIGNR